MSTGTSQCFKCGEVCDEETLCSCISADKDKTEADPLARWRTIRLTGADILEDMNSLPVDVSKIEFVQATDFDRLAARVQKLEAALRIAAGYISAADERFKDKHPQDAHDWLIDLAEQEEEKSECAKKQ